MTARQRWLNRRNSPFPSAGGLTSTTLSDFGDGAHPVLCFSTSAGFSHPRNRKSCRTQSAPDWRRGRRISPWQSGTSGLRRTLGRRLFPLAEKTNPAFFQISRVGMRKQKGLRQLPYEMDNGLSRPRSSGPAGPIFPIDPDTAQCRASRTVPDEQAANRRLFNRRRTGHKGRRGEIATFRPRPA